MSLGVTKLLPVASDLLGWNQIAALLLLDALVAGGGVGLRVPNLLGCEFVIATAILWGAFHVLLLVTILFSKFLFRFQAHLHDERCVQFVYLLLI